MSTRPLARALCLLLALAGAAPLLAQREAPPELVPLAPPPDSMEKRVREQIEAHRRSVDELGGAEPEIRAAAYGRLGQLYLFYDFEGAAADAFENARRLAPEDFRWSYYLGVIHQEEGDLEEAAKHFRRALELQPELLPAILRLGQAALDLGRLEEAEGWFERARNEGGAQPPPAALYGLGQVALEAGELERAVELFRDVLRQRPEASAIHYQLGLAYRQLGDLDAAREHLAQRGDRPPGFSDPLIDALSLLNTGAGAHMDRGNAALAAGDLDAAVAAYRQAAETAPENLQARRALASVLARKGELDEALDVYDELLRQDPGDPVAHFNVGNVHAGRGDLEAAADSLRRAVELAPDFGSAHFNLALVLDQQGHLEQAVERARAAVAADPEDRQPKLLLAALLLRTEDLEAAREAAETAPDLPQTHLALASALGRAGHMEEAARSYDRAVALQPENEEAHFGRATSLLLAGREGDAREALEESLERFPDSLPLRHALARLLAAAREEAVRDGERALELAMAVFRDYASVEHGATLAMAYAELGRFEEAVAWQRRIVDRAESVGREEILPELRRHLENYVVGEPVRAPWRGAPEESEARRRP